jgi:hypothetical protein
MGDIGMHVNDMSSVLDPLDCWLVFRTYTSSPWNDFTWSWLGIGVETMACLGNKDARS